MSTSNAQDAIYGATYDLARKKKITEPEMWQIRTAHDDRISRGEIVTAADVAAAVAAIVEKYGKRKPIATPPRSARVEMVMVFKTEADAAGCVRNILAPRGSGAYAVEQRGRHVRFEADPADARAETMADGIRAWGGTLVTK